jgi:anti-anti-sigma regulatory factor
MEIKEVSEREIWVGESRFYLGEDKVLYETIVGDIDETKALELKEAVLKVMNRVDGKLDILIDLNKARNQSSKARKMGKEMFELKQNGKIALFGMHPVSRVIASFVIGITKKEDVRFFKTRQEALAWLKEGKV